MNDLSQVVSCYQDVCYFPNLAAAPGSFAYIPGNPQASLDASGHPIASLLVSDAGAILQVQAQWAIAPPVRAEIIRAIASSYPDRSPTDISLQFARVSNPQVRLLVGDGQGQFREVATTQSSGMVPYTTVLNLRLNRTDKERAIAAFQGNPNYLQLKYSTSVRIDAAVRVAIAGNVAADVQQLAPSNTTEKSFWHRWWHRQPRTHPQPEITLETSLAQIEIALTAGRLQLTQTKSNHPTEALQAQVERAAKRHAAQQLLQFVQMPVSQEVQLQSQAQERESQTYDIERTADVSSWLASSSGGNYIQISPATIPEPTAETPPHR
jgi:hypothetical protein